MVILVRTPEDVEKLIQLAAQYDIRSLTVGAVTVTRFSRPTRAQEELIVAEPEGPPMDALERKRDHYTLAFGGRVPSDRELSQLPGLE